MRVQIPRRAPHLFFFLSVPVNSRVVKEILRETLSKAGSVKTEKKTVAQKANMAKLNVSYTTEQRKAAAKKAWERRKAKQENV